ncbi:MAG: response regulator [Deltaproteobacteria bacterium]|nr:response regulator [Deltaproteobacteria bacterium]MBW1793501.1 response regulator [Deltaproteobacteria bacterium]MBW2331411.1 response regulator [Deltaproteobacteria bacterium]
MNEHQHTVLCVDDEENILHSLKRLLRKEGYRLLTAISGAEGLKLFEENEVHLVISDQRMPQMSGTEFLSVVKDRYPDAIRVVLTGYTDVDAITESINKGHVYKFFLKPWNDQSLKLEIKQALDQYDLIQANKMLDQKVVQKNEELKKINENLEMLVQERTKELEIQNQALELSQAILEDVPIPIIGVSEEGLIVLVNEEARTLSCSCGGIDVGKGLVDCFSNDVEGKIASAFTINTAQTLKGYRLSDKAYDIDLTPLSGRFSGQGIVLTLKQVEG